PRRTPMPEPSVLPGAEPFSSPGGPHGALVLHGFTGCPQSMRGLAEAFASAGFAVELPRLPGHGTSIDDMLTTGWADWSGAAEAERDLFENLGRINCPVLIMTSPQDHVVPPGSSDVLAERVAGPVERVTLERSYHVATLDYDKDEIERRAVEFARKVTAGS